MKDVDLNSKSLADLKYIAQLMGLSEYENLNKRELIFLISGKEAAEVAPTNPPKRRGRPPKNRQAQAAPAADVTPAAEVVPAAETTPAAEVVPAAGVAPAAEVVPAAQQSPRQAEVIQEAVSAPAALQPSDLPENAAAKAATNAVPNKKRRGRPPKKKPQTEPSIEGESVAAVPLAIPGTEEMPGADKPVLAEPETAPVAETPSETDAPEPSPARPSNTFVRKTGGNKRKRNGADNGNNNNNNHNNNNKSAENAQKAEQSQAEPVEEEEPYDLFEGMLDVLTDGYGFLRSAGYLSGNRDVYVAPVTIKKYGLKTGDMVYGKCKMQKDNEKFPALFQVLTINGFDPEVAMQRKPFETLIPIYPDEKLRLEVSSKELSTRLIDLISPIGKGQRGIIVSPPKAGKTVLLKKIANSITANYPEIELIVLLIDERPEEVTDMRESIQGDVVSSTFDEVPERHIKVAEMVIERAQRLVEHGKDVVILLDSMTRLARAYNLTIPPTGRTLSGGLDPGALHKPKRFFGSARNIRDGGSLTIVSTALVDTGSKMDEVIYEEFKGTGNMELHLDRKLSEKRIFPAIDINKSGTRKEELLLNATEMNSMWAVRKAMANLGTADVTEMIVSKLLQTKTNEDFVKSINTSFGKN